MYDLSWGAGSVFQKKMFLLEMTLCSHLSASFKNAVSFFPLKQTLHFALHFIWENWSAW